MFDLPQEQDNLVVPVLQGKAITAVPQKIHVFVSSFYRTLRGNRAHEFTVECGI
jgi:hypothetical protein